MFEKMQKKYKKKEEGKKGIGLARHCLGRAVLDRSSPPTRSVGTSYTPPLAAPRNCAARSSSLLGQPIGYLFFVLFFL
jgi:hypothetical protein